MNMAERRNPTDIQDYEPDADRIEPNEPFAHRQIGRDDCRISRPSALSSSTRFMQQNHSWDVAVLNHHFDNKALYDVSESIIQKINLLNSNTERPPLSLVQCQDIQCKPIITALDDIIYRKARGLLIFVTPNFYGDKGYCGILDSVYRCSLDLKFPVIIVRHGFTDGCQRHDKPGIVNKNLPSLEYEEHEYFFSSLNKRIYSNFEIALPKTNRMYTSYLEASAIKKKQTEQKKCALQSAAELKLSNNMQRQLSGIEKTLTDKNKVLSLETAVVEDGSEHANKKQESSGEQFASNAISDRVLTPSASVARTDTGHSVKDLENSGRESPTCTDSDSAFASGSLCEEPLAETEQLNDADTLETNKKTGNATKVGETENPPGQNDEKDNNATCVIMPKSQNSISADGNQSSAFSDQEKMGKNDLADQRKPFHIAKENEPCPNGTSSQWIKMRSTTGNVKPKHVANVSHDIHPMQLGLNSFVNMATDSVFLHLERNNSSLKRIPNHCKTLTSSPDNIAENRVPSGAGRNKNKNCSWPSLSRSKQEASAYYDDHNITDEDLFGYGPKRKDSVNQRVNCSAQQSARNDFDGASRASEKDAGLTDRESTKKSQNDMERLPSRQAGNASGVNINAKGTMDLPASTSINKAKSINHKTHDKKERNTDKENLIQSKESCLKYDLVQQQSIKSESDLKLRKESGGEGEKREKEQPGRQQDEKSPGHNVTSPPNSAAEGLTNSASAASTPQANPDTEKSVSTTKSPIFPESDLTTVKLPFSTEKTTQVSEGKYIANEKMHHEQPVRNTTKDSPVNSDDRLTFAEKIEETKQLSGLSTGDPITTTSTLSRQATPNTNPQNITKDLEEDAERIDEKEQQLTSLLTGNRLCDKKISRFQASINDARLGPSSSKDMNCQDIEKRVEQKQLIGIPTGKRSSEKMLPEENQCESLTSEAHAQAPASDRMDNEIPDKGCALATHKAADSVSFGNALGQHFFKDGHAERTDKTKSEQLPQDHLDFNTNLFENGFANNALFLDKEKHQEDFEGLKGPASLGLIPRHNCGVEDSTIDLRQHRIPFKTPVQARQPVEEMMNKTITALPSKPADEFKMATEPTRQHSEQALEKAPMNPNTIHININFAQTENCAIVVGDGPTNSTRKGSKLATHSEATARKLPAIQQLPSEHLTTEDLQTVESEIRRKKSQKKRKRKKNAD